MIITLEPNDLLKIQFKDTDGEFQVHFDTKEHESSVVVKETAGMPGSIIGKGNSILYREDFEVDDGVKCEISSDTPKQAKRLFYE